MEGFKKTIYVLLCLGFILSSSAVFVRAQSQSPTPPPPTTDPTWKLSKSGSSQAIKHVRGADFVKIPGAEEMGRILWDYRPRSRNNAFLVIETSADSTLPSNTRITYAGYIKPAGDPALGGCSAIGRAAGTTSYVVFNNNDCIKNYLIHYLGGEMPSDPVQQSDNVIANQVFQAGQYHPPVAELRPSTGPSDANKTACASKNVKPISQDLEVAKTLLSKIKADLLSKNTDSVVVSKINQVIPDSITDDIRKNIISNATDETRYKTYYATTLNAAYPDIPITDQMQTSISDLYSEVERLQPSGTISTSGLSGIINFASNTIITLSNAAVLDNLIKALVDLKVSVYYLVANNEYNKCLGNDLYAITDDRVTGAASGTGGGSGGANGVEVVDFDGCKDIKAGITNFPGMLKKGMCSLSFMIWSFAQSELKKAEELLAGSLGLQYKN